jgi:threonine dehydrogenase-like Zn-dependent dehydrogenase
MQVVSVARRPAPNPAAAVVEAAGGRYVSTRETPLAEVAAALPSIDLILEATGVSAVAFQAMEVLGSNGVLVLLSLTGGDEVQPVPTDAINREFVLGNKVLVGSVNSAHEDFVTGVADLARFEALWPGLTARLITHRLRAFDDAVRIGEAVDDGIKTVVEFSGK